jgi:predicted nucleotidyltransferase
MALLGTIETRRDRILRLANQFGAKNVRLFSCRWFVDDPQFSDIGLLVDWNLDAKLTDWVGFEESLARLCGAKISVVSESALHWYVRARITGNARPL